MAWFPVLLWGDVLLRLLLRSLRLLLVRELGQPLLLMPQKQSQQYQQLRSLLSWSISRARKRLPQPPRPRWRTAGLQTASRAHDMLAL